MKSLLMKLIVVFFFALVVMPTIAQDEDEEDLDLLELDLEALLQVEVTSVSKTAERLQDVPVSLYVITSDDIEKSGATQLHELLMMVPGYWGVQNSYSDVAFSMRYSAPDNGDIGSVLFLLDGTPMQEIMAGGFSWRNFDIPLEDIDRIEVIKGSGGTVYGANSATGVISIYTKNPEDYDKASLKIDSGYPGFISGSVSGGMNLGNLSLGGYAKLRHFEGYGRIPEMDGDVVTVPTADGGTTTIPNRFKDNYEKIYSSTFGFKLNYQISDKSKISYRNHVNLTDKISYTNVFDPETFYSTDVLFRNQNNLSRVVSHLRFDTQLSENNSFFARMSTNREDDFYDIQGGFQTSNIILDFEVQDNFNLGESNSISLGANYRLVHFDIYNINAPDRLAYVNPLSNENLYGFFAQDKVGLFDGKLNLTLGAKMEKYTLVSEDFYFSPQAKFAFIPTESVTIWGGFTKSYTTPGFNQTNVDIALFRAPVYPFMTAQVYNSAYQSAKEAGASDPVAQAIADTYINSPQGKATIDYLADPFYDQSKGQDTYNVGVKNGDDTKPTSFTNYELGFRTSAIPNVLLEVNGFYSEVADAIAPSLNVVDTSTMIAIENSVAEYYLYGNFSKATSQGAEAIIKAIPTTGLNIEASYTYLSTEAEYQDGSDFYDSLTVEERNLTLTTPKVPQGIIRWKVSYKMGGGLLIALNGLHASEYNSDAAYNFEAQNYESIIAGSLGLPRGVRVAENKSRNIFNFKVQKSFMSDKLDLYVFGNDFLNFDGRIENTVPLANVTLSQTKAFYGLGINLKL